MYYINVQYTLLWDIESGLGTSWHLPPTSHSLSYSHLKQILRPVITTVFIGVISRRAWMVVNKFLYEDCAKLKAVGNKNHVTDMLTPLFNGYIFKKNPVW